MAFMVVLITNVTDAPGKDPIPLDIYNRILSPGAQIRIPADLVTKKIRDLETRGLIAIGNLPPWYITAKRRSRPLSEEERQKRNVVPQPEPIPIRVEKQERQEKKDREPAIAIKKG